VSRWQQEQLHHLQTKVLRQEQLPLESQWTRQTKNLQEVRLSKNQSRRTAKSPLLALRQARRQMMGL
jgi:hypothetical protein